MFPTLEGLYHYMLATDADVDDCVIVELEAVPAEDLDFDADQGAMLVIPRRVVRRAAIDEDLVRQVEERAGSPRLRHAITGKTTV